jgi:hypothetical protein
MTPDYKDLTARAAESHLTVCRMLSPWASDLPQVVDANRHGAPRRGIHGKGTLSLKDIGIPTSLSPLIAAPKALATGTVIALTDQALDTLLITAAMTARYRLVDVSAYPRRAPAPAAPDRGRAPLTDVLVSGSPGCPTAPT